MSSTPTITLISDSEADAMACEQALMQEYKLHRPAERGSLQDDFEEVAADLVIMTIRAADPEILAKIQRLRLASRARPVPLMAVVDQLTSELECRLLAEGADDVLRLPLDAAVLQIRVRRCLAREKTAEDAMRFADYRAVMRQLALSFISTSPEQIEPRVHDALGMVGRLFAVDRVFSFSYDLVAGTSSSTCEWCADGVSREIEDLQRVLLETLPEWVGAHSTGRPLVIESVADLPAGNLRDVLERQRINSLIACPLMEGNTCRGFVGMDAVGRNRHFGVEESELLRFFAELLVGIDQRRQAESIVQKLSLAVEQSSEAIIITNVNGEIEYVNDTFTRQSGFERQEVLGRTPSLLSSGKTPAEIYAQMWRALRAGKAWKGQFVNRHKRGHEYHVFSIITPLSNPDNEITHFVAVNEDITEKKRIGQELDRHRHQLEELVIHRTSDLQLAKELAEQANKAKSEFLANMSHELRTPLNSVLGMTEVLQMGDVYGPVNERQFDALEQIRESGQHLLKLISEILDLTRIEAGKLTLECRPMNAASVAGSALQLMEQTAQAKKIHLCYRQGEDMQGLMIDADEQRVRQILFNLIGNAIKFTPSGGQVSLQLELDRAAGRLLMVVTDTGEGIPLDAQRQLFQPFTQFETSTTKKHAGSGLGLSIVKRLMDMHGGEVTVRSAVNQGSVFTVHFPWDAPDRVSAPVGLGENAPRTSQ